MDSSLRAVLWDLDGTLVDSESYWAATEMAIAEEHGAAWGAVEAKAMIGAPIEVTVSHMIASGVKLAFDELEATLMRMMAERIRTDGIPFRPGARELYEDLRSAGVPQAIVTMSYGPYMEALLDELPEFDHVQQGDSVVNGKPAPDIYDAAMAVLGVTARTSLGIEDSVPGTGAILAAGVTPVYVPFIADVPHDERLVRIGSLTGWDAAGVGEAHARWQASGIGWTISR